MGKSNREAGEVKPDILLPMFMTLLPIVIAFGIIAYRLYTNHYTGDRAYTEFSSDAVVAGTITIISTMLCVTT